MPANVFPMRTYVQIALEGLYLHATGFEFKRPEAPPNREMRALQTFFEALHGGKWFYEGVQVIWVKCSQRFDPT